MGFSTDSWTTGGVPGQSTVSAPNPYGGFSPTTATTGTIQDQAAVLYSMSDAERKAFAAKLKKAGFNVKVSGAKSNTIAIADALMAAQQMQLEYETRLKKKYANIDDFLNEKASGFLGAGPAGPTTSFDKSINISAPTEARALIQQQFQDILGREATQEELDAFTQKLNAAEKKNAQLAKSTTKKTGTGSSTSSTYSGGINRGEFLAEQIKKLPEFAQKKADAASLTAQSIQATIRANGLTLPQDQIDAWTKAVQNGTKLDVVLNQIRNIASVGMPDNVKKMLAEGTDLSTIYSPYRNAMAAVLELNPNSIELNDPTLRSAITQTGEMPVYDFQRALRKDPRWQYTNNAREDVSNSVTQVLQDFGFKG